MSDTIKILVILVLLASTVSAYNWTTPSSGSSTNGGTPSHPVIYGIDNNLGTYWSSSITASPTLAWDVTYDMVSTQSVDAVQIYSRQINGGPCKLTSVKVCDDSGCVGESTLLPTECAFSTDWGYHICNITSTAGRYIKLEGGVWSGGSCYTYASGINLNEFYEFKYSIPAPPPSAPPIEAGPCKKYCDNYLVAAVPYPGANTGTKTVKLNLTCGGTCLNLEGQSQMLPTLTNLQILTVNGSQTGTCAGSTPGTISNIRLFNGTSPYSVLADVVYGSNSSSTCTVSAPQITACINGTYNSYSYITTASDTSDVSYTKDVLTDSIKYNHYNISFRTEEHNRPYDFTGKTGVMEVYCSGSYSNFPFKQSITGDIIYQTATPSINKITVDGANQIRTIATVDSLNYTSYLVNTSYHIYTLQLNDYTGGQWYKSTLALESNINNAMMLVHNETFDNDGYIYFYGRNGSEYRLTLWKDGSSLNIGTYQFTTDIAYRKLTITEPRLSTFYGIYDGLNISSFIGDYNNKQISVVVSSNHPITSTMSIYNTSGMKYVNIYNSTSSSQIVSHIYSVGDVGASYYATLTVNSSKYGILSYSALIRLTNQSVPLNASAFNPTIPDTILGQASQTYKKLIGLFIVMFVFFIATKASNVGDGLLFGCLTANFFSWINYFPQTETPFWFFVTLTVLAGAFKLVERRVS